MIHDCSLGEMMIGAIARTIEDSTLAFQWLVTDLGVFDFNDDGHLRLRKFIDTTVEEVAENTGLSDVADDL